MRYAVVIERGPTGYGAYVPDPPGCVAVAETRAEVVRLIAEAVEFHLEAMREGLPWPEPLSSADYVEVAAARANSSSDWRNLLSLSEDRASLPFSG